ncbi:hypothetical protein [Microbacterium schleiferi]|uniref:hypothetical protein n=1 Tax=Microbacterium schleiferi TaxID=69362 RepID=UPI00311DED67|tara:strand:+ start:202 stop:378 length:177 start_codon:yes stop_codon:yes gene_type:complete
MDTLTLRNVAGETRDVIVHAHRHGRFATWYDRVHDVELYPSAWRSLGWEPWAYATVDA